MTKAPKEIWLDDHGDFINAHDVTWSDCKLNEGDTSYTRTDTIPAWSTDMGAAPRDGMFLMKNHDGIIHQCKWSCFGFYSVSSKSYLSPTHWRHIDLPQTKETK